MIYSLKKDMINIILTFLELIRDSCPVHVVDETNPINNENGLLHKTILILWYLKFKF